MEDFKISPSIEKIVSSYIENYQMIFDADAERGKSYLKNVLNDLTNLIEGHTEGFEGHVLSTYSKDALEKIQTELLKIQEQKEN